MSGLLHPGGAGTTAAGLLAGKPALVTPLMMDQHFFAKLGWRHGAGLKPLPVKDWRADILAGRLSELTGVPAYGKQAKRIAAGMAKEDGPVRARWFGL